MTEKRQDAEGALFYVGLERPWAARAIRSGVEPVLPRFFLWTDRLYPKIALATAEVKRQVIPSAV